MHFHPLSQGLYHAIFCDKNLDHPDILKGSVTVPSCFFIFIHHDLLCAVHKWTIIEGSYLYKVNGRNR